MQQIQSLLNQTYSNCRLIIRDDGSTDTTLSVLNELAKAYPDKIIVYNENNIGIIKSFEWLIAKSDAEYIMFCDHDDVWLKTKIEDTILKMIDLESKQAEKPLLVFSDLKVVDENLNLIHDSFWNYSRFDVKLLIKFNYLGVCNCITGCTVMINKKAKEICLPFSDKARMHDSWIALNVSKFGEIDYVDKPTMLYRQHDKNQLGAKESFTKISYLTSRIKSLSEVIKGNKIQFKLLKELDYGNIFKYVYYKLNYYLKARTF